MNVFERGTSELRTPFQSSVAVHWRIDGSTESRSSGSDLTDPLVLCLHGWGMNEDWFSLLLQGLFDLPCRFLVPRATLPVERKPQGRSASTQNRNQPRQRPASSQNRDQPQQRPASTQNRDQHENRDRREAHDGNPEDVREAASWYEYDGNQERFRAELARTEALFLSLLEDVERRYAWRPRARFLLGFSQGGYCGSVAALRHPEIFDGIIISGARVKTEILEDEIRAAGRSKLSALLLHGMRDEAVRLDAAERSRDGLARGGVDVRLETFDAGHSLGRVQIAAIREWLDARIRPRG